VGGIVYYREDDVLEDSINTYTNFGERYGMKINWGLYK